MSVPVLEVKALSTSFFTDKGEIPAVEDVHLTIHEGEIVGIVGESGCGKSVTSLSIMRLVPQPPGKIKEGSSISLLGKELTTLKEKEMRKIRGNDIAMIFQEPMTSLNPLFTIGDQLDEVLTIHRSFSKQERKSRAIDMLKLVGLPRAESLLNDYPHQLSGGMRQRVMIAMALLCEPKLLIADEPTTALDVTIQAQMMDLMKELNQKLGTAIMLITHDLGVVAETCDRVIVMYAGQVVEEATVEELFQHPKHPYTQGLLSSIPDMREKKERLYSIPGTVPVPGSIKNGCRFAERCPKVTTACNETNHDLRTIGEGHYVRCLHAEGVKA